MANTFVLPAAGKSQTLSRVDYNETLRSVLSLAYGEAIPNSTNFEDEGVVRSPYIGMLHRNSKYNAVYIYDPNAAKGGGLGGGFTRMGIGTRNFEDITKLVGNIAKIEVGELITTVGDSSANYRAYLKTSNSNTIVDIGIPPSNSILTTMFIDRQVTNVKLAVNTITQYEIAPYTIIGNKLSNNLTYSSNLQIAGNIVGTSSTFGITFADGTRQTTGAIPQGQNVTTSTTAAKANVYGGMLGSNLRFKSVGAYTEDTGSLYQGEYRVTMSDDNSANAVWFVLQRGTASVPVGVGVGVGVGK